MAAVKYVYVKGNRIEEITETAGTHPSVTANTDAIAMSTTAVAAAIGVLVADAAAPTQAHVNTANAAWITLLALIVTAKASALAAVPSGGVEVSVLTGQKALEILLGLEQIEKRVATSKVLAP